MTAPGSRADRGTHGAGPRALLLAATLSTLLLACGREQETVQGRNGETESPPACQVPASILASVPDAPPPEAPYTVLGRDDVPFEQIPLGIGHLHPAEDAYLDQPLDPNWPRRVELPLSATPNAEPFAGIARGWVARPGTPPQPLTMEGLLETGYEEPSFVVLEHRPDGWLRIRYAAGEGDAGTAWVPTCALRAGAVALDFTPWAEWLLSGRVSPLFFRAGQGEMHAEPSAGSSRLAEVSGDYILEPQATRGEWMRVTLKQPSDFCFPEVVPTRSEGWVRWHSPELGPLVWYFTRGC